MERIFVVCEELYGKDEFVNIVAYATREDAEAAIAALSAAQPSADYHVDEVAFGVPPERLGGLPD